MKCLLTVISFIIFLNSYAQKFSGQVVDKRNNVPIPYASIGVLNKNIGTVSNNEGYFQLELNDKLDNETIRIASIGYESVDFKVSDIKITNGSFDFIKLTPKIYNISEVVICPEKTKAFTLGNRVDSTSCYANAFYAKKLGTEIGVVMRFPKRMKTARLRSFRFSVSEFTYNKFPVRLNVYNLKNGLPADNILREPIFIEITSNSVHIIDLTKYAITLSNDFFVALEYYRIADNKEGKLLFSSVQKGHTSLFRQASQGNWQRFKKGYAELGFSVIADCKK